jgi:hypothetical protein
MEGLAGISVSRKTGAESLTSGGLPTGQRLADFWGWSGSDLLDNVGRGVLAEFIVATALGIPTDGVRVNWSAWDLTTPGGIRIEVKSAAYLQSWAQKQLSAISFSTPKTLAWDEDTGEWAGEAGRHAQVYVFALLAHTDPTTVNPLDLDQWAFYVLPTAVLDARSQQSITLKTLQGLTAAVGFGELRGAVEQGRRPT